MTRKISPFVPTRFRQWIAPLLGAWSLTLAAWMVHADSTFVYAVQISATVQTDPPVITLNWEPDPYGAKSYSVYRKSKTDGNWGSPTTLSGSATSFSDTDVEVGATYEYQIVKQATLGYVGYGYIYSGIQAPMTENRGTLILVVATNSTASLANELARLRTDLIGDGWSVIRHDVSSNDTPASVKALITAEYYADPANVDCLVLFGHVPILQSGFLNYDGHYTRAMPADAFYGDMNNDWPTDGDPTNRPSYLPSDVALMVGRVDMFNLPGNGAAVPWPSETELLRNYLNKDHNWRNHLINVRRQALMGNRRGDVDGTLAMAASGYRNFEPFVGPGNTIEANIQDNAPVPQRWISMLSSGSYIWAFGDGGGQPNSISYLGTNEPYNIVLSTDVVGKNAQAVWVMMFGSFFGNWDDTDNIMRSVLATPGVGLGAFMAGEPHWYVHHMGLGETIGYGTRLTMNNSTLYQSASNTFTRAVYIALMGDPSLRMEPLAPPSGLSAIQTPGGVALNWAASPDAVLGYHVYRANSADGAFARLTSSWVTGNNYTDTSVSAGNYTYMVRAVTLQTNPSGSYYNLSEGVFAPINTVVVTPPSLTATPGDSGITLQWDSIPGFTYRVLGSDTLQPPSWTDLSGTITAAGPTTVWGDTDGYSSPQRFYRVASP